MNYRDMLYKHLEDLQAQTAALMEMMSLTADDPLTPELVRDMDRRVYEIENTGVEIDSAMSYVREQV